MSDSQTTLTVDEFGVRLDKRLTTQFDYSRSFFVHLFDRGAISVRGKTAKKSYKTRPGDKVTIESLDRFVDGGILDESPVIDLPVHHETDDYLVLYKPKGVLSHPNSIRDVGQPSVVGFLYHRYRDLPSIGNFIRAGLIHRLDRETDGLMIAAKTEAGMAYFKNLFLQKSQADTIDAKDTIPLKKYYRALCDITPAGQEFLATMTPPPPGHLPSRGGSIASDLSPQEGGCHEVTGGSVCREGVHIIDADVIPRTPYPVVKRGITKILRISSSPGGEVANDSEPEGSLSRQEGEFGVLEGKSTKTDFSSIAQERGLMRDGTGFPYNPKNRDRAVEMRKSMTPAERKLWFVFLKDHKVKFYRQRLIDHYIVDFYCNQCDLVIEIDGDSHYQKGAEEYDKERTELLEFYGLRVIRFTNDEVYNNIKGVMEVIQSYIETPPPSTQAPTLAEEAGVAGHLPSRGGSIAGDLSPQEGGCHEVTRGSTRVMIHLEILTGRTHQIRYHLSSIGLPIVGDYLYHDDHNEDEKLGLTAYCLTFTDLYGEHITCEVDHAQEDSGCYKV